MHESCDSGDESQSDLLKNGSHSIAINREFYGSKKPGQMDYWRKMAAPRHRVATIIQHLVRSHPESIVDLGCGGGDLLKEIRRAMPKAELTGVDFSAVHIEHNRNIEPTIKWVIGDLESPSSLESVPSAAFDAVIASEVIEHLVDGVTMLGIAHRLAKPKGQLFLSTQSGVIRETERRVGHVQHYSAEEMFALLTRVGWKPVHIWNTGFPFHDLSKWYANRDPDRTMKQFGESDYGFYQNVVCAALRFAFQFNSRRSGAQLFAIAQREK